MLALTNNDSPDQLQQTRKAIRESSKLIIVALEGCVTEEEYILLTAKCFDDIKSKVSIISVRDELKNIADSDLTKKQKDLKFTSSPLKLYEKLACFKEEKDSLYQFTKDDEFWMVFDVDMNFSTNLCSSHSTYKDDLCTALRNCEQAGFHYAISNPCFEFWLLLHFSELSDEDKSYGVSDAQPYRPRETQKYIIDRLKKVGCRISKKHLIGVDLREEHLSMAVKRAEVLHVDKSDLCPKYCVSTIYLLIKQLLSMKQAQLNNAYQQQ